MGWDGAGGYTRQHNFSADASAGIKILALRVDQELDDIASAIPVALAKNGQNVPTANLPMGGFRHINVGAPTSVNNYMRVREFIENVPIFMQDVESSADRISVSAQYFTSVSANQAPGDGTRILVRANSNKSSAVLYLNGHSANVEYKGGGRIGSAVTSGGIYGLIYSSADTAWHLENPEALASQLVYEITAPETSAGITPTNFQYPPGHRYRYLSPLDSVDARYSPRTAAEISAGITPVNYQYEPGDVRRYGTNTVPGTTDMTTAVQAAIDVMQTGDTLTLESHYAITGSGLTITNKTDITITGPGKLVLVGADEDAVVLKLVGTCSDVRIVGIEIEGEALPGTTPRQYGIYNASGQTLLNIWVVNCSIHDLQAGINFNADTGGSYTNAFCLYNRVTNVLGTEGGQGYGCFASNVTNMQFVGNTIESCQRHSIYIAKCGTDPTADGEYSVVVRGNVIRNHRTAIASGDYRPAIFVARGFGTLVEGNYIIDYADGGIGVSQDDTDTNLDCGNVDVLNNVITGAQNANAAILLGEQADPVTEYLTNVRVRGNRIHTDISDSTNGAEISLSNGKNILIEDNHFHITNITASTHRPIQIGEFAAAGDTDMDNVLIRRNTLTGSGTANKVSLVFAFTDAATLDSRVVVDDNWVDPGLYLNTVEVQSSQTNARLVYSNQGGERIGLYTGADATPTVYGGVQFLAIANSGATTITYFDDGVQGQRLTTYMSDANTTFDVTGTNLEGGNTDITPAAGSILQWLNVNGTNWVLVGHMNVTADNSTGA